MYNTLKVHCICYCQHVNKLASTHLAQFVYLLCIVCFLCGEANVAACGQAVLARLEV